MVRISKYKYIALNQMEINPVFTKVKTISPIESIESSIGTNNEQLQSTFRRGSMFRYTVQISF